MDFFFSLIYFLTEEIFNITRKYLYDFDPGIAAIYGLERGLSALGPSGFLFEQYVAALFVEQGYKVKTNVYLRGEGVDHEIDVFAEKGNVTFIVEAKYRNDYKNKCKKIVSPQVNRPLLHK